MATSLSQRIVSSKVDILMEQRNYLQTFVDETDKVLQMATSWLRNEDTTKSFTFTEISMIVEDKLTFLVNTDFSAGCKEVTKEQAPVDARSFPSAPKSTDQPLPAGHVHVSGVTVSSDELKTVLSQVNVMQDAMSSLSTSSKMLSEKQLAMEKLVESLSDKYSKVEQEKLREIERELEDIKEKHEKAAIQQDKRMTSFEKKIQSVTDTQSDIIENCHQQQIKIKDQKKETERLKTQSQQFTKDLSDVSENVHELNAEISALEQQTAITTQMGALEEEIESLKENLEELSTRFEEHGSSLEELSKRFKEHGSLLEELSMRFEEHGSSLEELTQKNNETLKVLSSAQESESKKLQKLEEKLSALENSWSETTVENGKLCQDVETKYEIVCQVVTDRLVPLEKLRDIFNEKLDARIEHIKKLDNVCDQMTDLLPKILQVEQQTQRQAIGFSASSFTSRGFLKYNQTLYFPDVTSNIGAHFDSKTGEFTAPLDGLYAVFFSVDIKGCDGPEFYIIKKPCSCEHICNQCACIETAELNGVTHASAFGLVEMKSSEKLFVKCLGVKEETFIESFLQFTCFKIS